MSCCKLPQTRSPPGTELWDRERPWHYGIPISKAPVNSCPCCSGVSESMRKVYKKTVGTKIELIHAYPNSTASAKELNRNLYLSRPGSWTWWNLCPMHGLQYQCCVHSQITQVSTLDKCDFLQSLASTTPSSSSNDSVDDPSAKSISSFQPWNACDLLDKIHPSDGDVAGSKPETVPVKISTCSVLRSSYANLCATNTDTVNKDKKTTEALE